MNDGGPAYPTFDLAKSSEGRLLIYHSRAGMSLRDWLAGQVLMGGALASDESWDIIAERCYRAADAMLIARDKAQDQSNA